MNGMKRVRILTESALCVAMAAALSMITLFKMPLGGSVTPFATLPVIMISLRHGSKWGVAGALVFSLTQLALGVANVVAVPVRSIGNMALCIALDYVVAYSLLGFTGAVARRFNKPVAGVLFGVFATGMGRLFCSFLSGIIVWGPFAPEGWNVALYSLAYNAAWCLPDTAITLAACLLMAPIRALGILPAKERPAADRVNP